MKPDVGMVATCRHGLTGLITRVVTMIDTGDGAKPLYRGVCLDNDRVGKPWESLYPEIIADSLDKWVKIRYTELGKAHMARIRGLVYPIERDADGNLKRL